MSPMLPVFRPLKTAPCHRLVRLCTSTIGEDLFRVAVVWLAAEVSRQRRGLVNGAQYGAMLVVGLFGASLFDRWRADRAMIGSQVLRAPLLALLPVAGFYIWGMSIPLLVIS